MSIRARYRKVIELCCGIEFNSYTMYISAMAFYGDAIDSPSYV